jgi:hypothetical protein
MSEVKTAKPIKKRKIKLDEALLAYRGVWVFIESERGHVHPVSWELMGQGRQLADQLGVELCGVVMGAPGHELDAHCNSTFHFGADRCYRIASPVLADYRNVALHQGADRSGQHAQAGNPAARRDDAGPRPGRLGGDHAEDRPHRRLHRTRDRPQRPLPAVHAADLRRQPAVHHRHAQLPAADGDRAPPRDADARAATRAYRPGRRLRPGTDRDGHRHQDSRIHPR